MSETQLSTCHGLLIVCWIGETIAISQTQDSWRMIPTSLWLVWPHNLIHTLSEWRLNLASGLSVLYTLFLSMPTEKKGTKLHFKTLTTERKHILCVGVGGDRTHAARPGGAGYARPSRERSQNLSYKTQNYGSHILKSFDIQAFTFIPVKRLQL